MISTTALLTSSPRKPGRTGQNSDNSAKLFVLVHGAWMAPYVWNEVKLLLENSGHRVMAVELPGHGTDKTSPATITMDLYKNAVIAALATTDRKVILVGHSLAGMVISAVAEQIPGKIKKLVYIAALVPLNGQAALDLASKDLGSLLGPSLLPSEDNLTLDVNRSDLIGIFCADAPKDKQQLMLLNYRPEPAAPFADKLTLSGKNFGRVDKAYIHTLSDHGITMSLQNEMVKAAGIRETYSLNSSHAPFLSMPGQLAETLLIISGR